MTDYLTKKQIKNLPSGVVLKSDSGALFFIAEGLVLSDSDFVYPASHFARQWAGEVVVEYAPDA